MCYNYPVKATENSIFYVAFGRERLFGPNFVCPGLRCPCGTAGGGKVSRSMSVPYAASHPCWLGAG